MAAACVIFVSAPKRQSQNASAALAGCAKKKGFHNRTSSLTRRTTRRGGNLRRFSQITSRQKLAKICMSGTTAKPPALGDADGFALSPQTMPRLLTKEETASCGGAAP